MSEYIPKYPSKEGDDSNKTSSELLAETLKPIYVPQDLMLAWETHLASYSRDTSVLLDQVKDSETALNTQYQALLTRVQKYEQMLQDITMDSNEFTMDTDEVNFTGWNILAQASYWDYLLRKEITKLSAQIKSTEYKGGLVTEVTDAVLVGLIADNTYISNVIGALSDTPLIRELDEALTSTTTSLAELQAEYVRLAEKQAADAEALANQQVENAEQLIESINTAVAEQLDRLAEEAAIRTQLLQELEAKTDAITADYNAVVDTLHTTVIQELTTMQDGISASVSELKTADEAIITSLDAYKVSNGQNIAALQNSVNVVTNAQESTASQVTGLVTSFNTLDSGLSKAQADIIASNQVRADEDEALSQQITTINTGLGEANSRIDTVSDSVSTLDSATAIKFTQLDTRFGGVDDSIASVRQIANSAVDSSSAQATEINTLKSRMGTTEGSLATKADASALSSLDTRVGTVEGQYTTQASDITRLNNSLDTTNVNVGTAQTAAQNAMNEAGAKGKVIFGNTAPAVEDRLIQNLWIDTTGNANTPKRWNGSAWVVVTDKVATDAAKAVSDLDNVVRTKADVSALNSLTIKVSDEADRTTANTNSITTLNSDIVSINNNLATKANASALNDIYTKQQTDDKATEIAAGEVSKYDASLVIGGTNLFSFAGAVAGFIAPENGEVVISTPAHQSMNTLIPLGSHKSMTYQVWNPAAIQNTANINRVAFFKADGSFLSVTNLPQLNGTTYQTALIQIPDAATHARLGVLVGSDNGARDESIKIKIEFGNKATDWSEADSAIVDSLNTNATAIETTNAEVIRVDGRVTTESNRITTLTGRVDTVENGLALKADVSALNAIYTKSETDAKATSIAAGEVSKYDANLVIGGTNLLLNSNFSEVACSDKWDSNGGGFTKVNDPKYGSVVQTNLPSGLVHDWVKLENNVEYVYSALVKPSNDLYMYDAVPLHYWAGKDNQSQDKIHVLRTSHGRIEAGKWTRISIVFKLVDDADSFRPFIYGLSGVLQIAWTKLERGNKATDWSPNDQEVQQSINVNANAIQTVNVEVSRINGEVVSTANSVNTLSSNVGLLQGSINEVRQTVTNNQESTNTLVTSLRSGMADADDVSMMMRSATVLYEDLSFKNGWNGVQVYNNYANGALVANFTDKLPDNPVASTRQIEFIHSGGATTPELGGFHQAAYSRANGVFLVKFVAKLPIGFSFDLAANLFGDGASHYFIGDSEGTGKFKTYYGVYRCGSTGSFSTVGFVYVNGSQPTPENPLIWYLASSTVYDCLDSKVAPDSVINGIAEAKSIASTAVNNSEATALIAQNLQASLDNTNANISNNYYTKSSTDEAISNQITNLSATLDMSVLPSKRDTTKANQWLLTHVVPKNAGWVSQGVKPDFSMLKTGIKNKRIYCADGNTSFSGSEYDNTVLYFRTIVYVHTDVEVNLGNFTGDDAHSIYVNGVLNFNKGYYGSTDNLRLALKQGLNTVDVICYNGGGLAGFSSSVLLSSLVVNMYAPESIEEQAAATANTVSSLTTTVSNIDGVVSSQARQIVTLESSKSAIENGAIAGNDEFVIDLRDSAYNRDLYYPVLLSGFSTEYRQTIRVMATLNSASIPPWASHYAGFSLNAQFQMGGAAWGVIDPETVTDNFSYSWTHGSISPLDEIGQVWTSSQPFFYVRGGGYYRLSKPVSRSVQVCAPGGSLVGYNGETLNPRPYQESTVPKSINQGLNQQNVKLQQTNTVLDGVKAVSTVTVDNNGVMSGYGLISQLVNGQVTSSFGVHADSFFIGAPAGGKKPFIVTTSSQEIDGITYPAGTWIDVALIANATIGTAKIADLAVTNAKIANLAVDDAKIANLNASKITAGTIDAARIGAGSITADKIQVDSLSAISANLGTIQVGSANIASGAITTANIGDLQVDTLKIKDQAVNVVVAANGVSQLSIQTSGGRVVVNIGINVDYLKPHSNSQSANSTFIYDLLALRVLRNGTIIKEYNFAATSVYDDDPDTNSQTVVWRYVTSLPLLVDQPTAGLQTYSIQVAGSSPRAYFSWQTPTESSAIKLSGISLSLTETKK